MIKIGYTENLRDCYEYAAAELLKYFTLMGVDAKVDCNSPDIILATFEDAGVTHNLEDTMLDDEIRISIEGGAGYIYGANKRSVLMGVYKYLEALGCKWLRPGKLGEVIPKTCDISAPVYINEIPSLKHRSVCIEGATSIEHALDVVEWLPKVGFNSYFVQFRDAYAFFDRWYSHMGNDKQAPAPIGFDTALEFVSRIKTAANERGLLIESVGHGWNCDPFGVTNHGWDSTATDDIGKEYVDLCALVNGERKVWLGMPMSGQLCYSRADIRERMTDGVLEYLAEHPEDDIVHFWLGDYYNNYCECDECTKLRPSDFYVSMLNDIDEKLTKKGLDTKIAFVLGYNIATPPLCEHIKNPDRFILIFAPISRSFSEAFDSEYTVTEIPEFKYNSFDLPSSTAENLAYLYQWKQVFSGRCLDFDYHLMWDHLIDGGQENISKIINKDIKNLSSLGLDGFISCQLQRNFCPSPLAMTTLARTLWNTDTDFEATRSRVYSDAFGEENSKKIGEYLGELSRVLDPGVLCGEKKIAKDKLREELVSLLDLMHGMKPFIKEKAGTCSDAVEYSYEILLWHNEIYSLLAEALIAKLDGNIELGDKLRAASWDVAFNSEKSISCALDAYFYQEMTTIRIFLNSEFKRAM